MMTTDGTQLPTTESVPPIGEPVVVGVPDGLSDEERERIERKKKILKRALALLAIIIAIILYFLLTGKPPIPGVLAPKIPHYAFSVDGPNRPMGVAVSPSGDRIYVTESGGKRLVRIYDRAGKQVGTLKPPGHAGQWSQPVYVAADPITGNVYVSDRLRRTIDIYSADGAYRGKFRARGRIKKDLQPLGLGFNPKGDLLMTDVSGRSHRVLVFGRDRKLLRKLGARGSFSFPNGIAVRPTGDTYVTDSNNGRLAIFSPAGKLVSSIRRGVADGELGMPRGVALDDDNRLYVVDTTSHTIKIYRLDDKRPQVQGFVGSFGQQGVGNGMFEYPNGIAVDGDGQIWITDRENNRVQVWRY